MLSKTAMVRWMIVGGIVAAAIGLLSPTVTLAQAMRVDCEAGESVQAALDAAAALPGKVTIRISGICKETIRITRDDVKIQGSGPSDGFSIDADNGTGIDIRSAKNVTIEKMSLSFPISETTHMTGLSATDVLQLGLRNLVVGGGQIGIRIVRSSADLQEVQVYKSWLNGVQVFGGYAHFKGVVIRQCPRGGLGAYSFADIYVRSSEISENGSFGIRVHRSNLDLGSTIIKGNEVGVSAFTGAYARLGDDVIITSNTSYGVGVRDQATLFLSGAAIEGNMVYGIYAQGASLIRVETTENSVSDNAASGIYLADTSLFKGYSVKIFDNGGWGIYCEGLPETAHVAHPGLLASSITGNGAGATNCPPLGISGRLP